MSSITIRSGISCHSNHQGGQSDRILRFVAVNVCVLGAGRFDLQEMASRYCTPDGTWYFNPNENRTWTNYSLCGYHHEPASVGNSTLIAVIDVWCNDGAYLTAAD